MGMQPSALRSRPYTPPAKPKLSPTHEDRSHLAHSTTRRHHALPAHKPQPQPSALTRSQPYTPPAKAKLSPTHEDRSHLDHSMAGWHHTWHAQKSQPEVYSFRQHRQLLSHRKRRAELPQRATLFGSSQGNFADTCFCFLAFGISPKDREPAPKNSQKGQKLGPGFIPRRQPHGHQAQKRALRRHTTIRTT
ncbi:uncharacterized protein LOC125087758 isoform X2 [Lutra lutra]|uniref:uncharacterized protein LOC125087758 isoform X2 n=1 Tax=Lutra lutra TaxID=9657 RepID=UPI001FD0F365|nr:uncharacterized protein LOC125087758 isoform X2 [Lutra lutra]